MTAPGAGLSGTSIFRVLMMQTRLSVLLMALCLGLAGLGLWLSDEDAAAFGQHSVTHAQTEYGQDPGQDANPALP